jgi:hypothetical protein
VPFCIPFKVQLKDKVLHENSIQLFANETQKYAQNKKKSACLVVKSDN